MRIIIVAALAALANGFVAAPLRSNARFTSSLAMSEPSDTSSDDPDILTVDNEPYTPTDEEALVNNVLDQLSTGLAGELSSETRSAINEALLKLEALNPTENPTMSPLLNGVWELKYAGGYASDWALPSPTR